MNFSTQFFAATLGISRRVNSIKSIPSLTTHKNQKTNKTSTEINDKLTLAAKREGVSVLCDTISIHIA